MDAISYSHSVKQEKRIKNFIANPDSNSGIVTVPKIIGAGESVTVPAGRVAVLPNIQIDGTLNVEGEVFIPSGATFSKVVETEGNQTIADVKTFSSSPIVPTPTAGDNSTKVATTAFVKAKSEADSIGVGQTWQNVIASRSANVIYTNNTGKPIAVAIVFTSDDNANKVIQLIVDGVIVSEAFYAKQTSGQCLAIVPNNSTYYINYMPNITWSELR